MSKPERGSIQGNAEQKGKAEGKPAKPPKPPSRETVVLSRWIEDKVPLVFLLKSGRTFRARAPFARAGAKLLHTCALRRASGKLPVRLSFVITAVFCPFQCPKRANTCTG